MNQKMKELRKLVKDRSKKKVKLFICSLAAFVLSGCMRMASEPPEYLELGNERYRTRFYGDLYPNGLEFTKEEFSIEGETYRRVKNDKFNWIHGFIGPKGETVYCKESEWDEAKAYYEDDTNYEYYCEIGVETVTEKPVTKRIQNMDSEKLQALQNFAKESDYDPFNPRKKVEKEIIDIPDEKQCPQLIFYKKSKDGYFISYRGSYFFIIDKKLYLLYYYKGENEMHIVKVPEELSDYFISVVNNLS